MNNIKKRLIKQKLFEESDFKNTNNEILISNKKYKKILNKEFNKINDKLFIKLQDIQNILNEELKIKVFENEYFPKIIELSESFNLLTIRNLNNLKFIESENPSKQFIFTYTFAYFIKDFFPNLSIKIEKKFYDNFQDINMDNGPRTDITIPEINMIIEFDEKHHNTFDNQYKDNLRDIEITVHGYDVIRYKYEEDDIFKFFKDLKILINNKYVMMNLNEKYGEYIIDICMEHNGGDREMIQILTTEQIKDIVESQPFNLIGTFPRNIKLKEHVFNWIGIIKKTEQQQIIDMLDEINEPYIEDKDDIILSPNAFDNLIALLDANIYEKVYAIRITYRNIKNILMINIFNNFKENYDKMIKNAKNMEFAINITTDRCEQKNLTEKNVYIKKIKDLETALEFSNKTQQQLLKDNKYIKENYDNTCKLIIGNPVINCIPELIYTGIKDDSIDESVIKPYYEHNKLKFKNVPPITKIIKEIRNKTDNNFNKNSLIKRKLFYCKIIENTNNKSKNTNLIDLVDSDNEEM